MSLKSKPQEFDIVLVLEYFRLAAPYLCIIKYLSSEFRVGLYLAPTEPAMVSKNGDAHRRFIQRCTELGATILNDGPATCKLLILQQRPYSDDAAAQILNQIQAERRVGCLTLALAGLEAHDRFLKQFHIDRVYVPNERLFRYLLGRRKAESAYASIDVVQVGLPYARYPLFPEFAVDYLIASPTQFSFHAESDKHIYLRNLLQLIDQIGRQERIAYKPHNGMGRDYFEPRGYAILGRFLARLPGGEALIERLHARCGSSAVKRFLGKTLTSQLFARLARRIEPLSRLTADAEFALEAFLPGVKKGVIGGLSNTIWGTLYFGLPFYNCVDDAVQTRNTPNALVGKDSRNLLDLNLDFFYVPCCHGQLKTPPNSRQIVTEADRKGDLVEAVRNDVR